MARHHRIAVVLMLLACAGAHAQSEAPAPRLAIHAARLLDIERGVLVPDATVLVDGENITAVSHGAPAPDGYRVLELGDATLLPGLIDAHTHLMASADDGYAQMLLTMSQAMRALEGAANARKTLMAGFTTVRDVENEGSEYADVALRDAIERGLVEGPRMRVATRGIVAQGQYHPFGVSSDLHDFPTGAQMVSGVDEARRAAREQIGHGADLIKVYADWQYPTLEPDELRVVVQEAHKAGRRVAAHATTVPGINNALDAGVDSIEHGFHIDRPTLLRMKQKGTWLVPTLGPYAHAIEVEKDDARRRHLQEIYAAIQQHLRMARDLGVRIAAGYDPAERALHGTNIRELLAMHEAGLTNLEVLRAATLSAAELMALQDRIGSIVAGKSADLIAVQGDPLNDLSVLQQVSFVMKQGRVVKQDRASPSDRP